MYNKKTTYKRLSYLVDRLQRENMEKQKSAYKRLTCLTDRLEKENINESKAQNESKTQKTLKRKWD